MGQLESEPCEYVVRTQSAPTTTAPPTDATNPSLVSPPEALENSGDAIRTDARPEDTPPLPSKETTDNHETTRTKVLKAQQHLKPTGDVIRTPDRAETASRVRETW